MSLCVWLVSLSICPQGSFMSEHMIESYRGRSDVVNSALKRTDHGSLLCDSCGEAVPTLPGQVCGALPTVCPEIPGKAAQTTALLSHLHGVPAAGSSVCVTPQSCSGESGSPHVPCWRAAVGSSVPWARRSSQRSHLRVCSRARWWAWSEHSSEELRTAGLWVWLLYSFLP